MARLNSKAIETLSVNAVRDSIVLSPYLDQFIPDNDKEPSWDGAVYIYNNTSHKKETLTGRMPVQVKGKCVDDLSQNTIKYRIKTVDLQNYLNDGGAIFFVVYLSHGGLNKRIYYVALTPVKIRMLLERSKKASILVECKEFPMDGNSKATIFLNCFKDCRKQASFTEAKLFTIDEIDKAEYIDELKINVSAYGDKHDLDNALYNGEVYMYAKTKGADILQPFKCMPGHIMTSENLSRDITVNGQLFYKQIKRVKSKGRIEVLFGESLKLITNDDESDTSVKMTYKTANNLNAAVVDLDFILHAVEAGQFEIDGSILPFKLDDMSMENFSLKDEWERLRFFKELKEALVVLKCEKNFLFSDATATDWKNAERIVDSILHKRPIKGLKENLPLVLKLSVSNIKLLLIFEHDTETSYNVYNFFDHKISTWIEDDVKKQIPQCCLIQKDDFLELDNIQYDKLLESFQSYDLTDYLVTRANQMMLDLISAYDKGHNQIFLNTAGEFADWLCNLDGNLFDKNISQINKLQIVKRARDLTQNEEEVLFSIAESVDNPAIIVGCYILLQQFSMANRVYGKMNESEQNEFNKYPINNMWIKDVT